MRLVFMGTASFAIPTLKSLLLAGHDVAAVYTQPDRGKGRGRQLATSPVKLLAAEFGVDVFQPAKIRDVENIELIAKLAPDVVVVVAYGQILPVSILELPRYGCINVHGSLLPHYRGAAPVQRAIMNGESVSGVTTMYMDKGLDTGDMILHKSVPIAPDITFGDYYDLLAEQGAILLLDTLDQIAWGTAPRIPQLEMNATYAPPLRREDEHIDFSRSAIEIMNQVRALAPQPGATAFLNGTPLKIHAAALTDCDQLGEPGEIMICSRGQGLVVQTGSGHLRLQSLQRPGKKRLTELEFICGSSNLQGCRFASLDAS
ncbi:MAG: methionyl-tRNA formyltransferase [Methylocystaceae bacterium]